jgi:predicted GIY-YIG superfamily endonuclease
MSKRERGFVYVIECETGHYKIGKTSGPAEHLEYLHPEMF